MDNGKENRLFIIENRNTVAQGEMGAISPPLGGVRYPDKISHPSPQMLQIPFKTKRAVDGDNALNVMNTAVKNVDQETFVLFSRMGDGEKGNSKLSRGSNANEKNLVHVGNGIAEREMARLSLMKKRKEEEEEEEALSSSSDTSIASTLLGHWPTDDKEDCVQSESRKGGLRRWFPSLFSTWMDQLPVDQVPSSSQQEAGLSIDSPLSYESNGTGEEDEVVEGEVSNIDDEGDEAEHPDVSMDSGQESGEEKELASQPSAKKRNVEELVRSLEEKEQKIDLQIKDLLSEWRAHRTFTVRRKDKLLTIFWDGGKRQWLVSDGVRCRKHNKVWDPPIPTDSPGKRKEDESGSRTIGVLEKRARKAESSKRQPDGFGSLFTT